MRATISPLGLQLAIFFTDFAAPVIVVSSRTAVSVNVSWNLPEYSLPAIQYSISLQLVADSCSSSRNRRPLQHLPASVSNMHFTGLEENSSYAITIGVRQFLGISRWSFNDIYFSTLAAGKQLLMTNVIIMSMLYL